MAPAGLGETNARSDGHTNPAAGGQTRGVSALTTSGDVEIALGWGF